ncbi:MAG: ribonuclease III [Acidaminobacteraceae bacterium]
MKRGFKVKIKKNEIEKIIAYKFQNPAFLYEALTHSSYSNERRSQEVKNNERLEFLGDSVLSIVISDYLFNNYTELPEGELTKIRSKIVCESTLGECSRRINIGQFMLFGKGEEMTGGRERTSILADAFEALIASIYMDGGLEQAKKFILIQMQDKIGDSVEGKVFLDYKTHLQEIVQVNKDNRIAYEIINEEGPDHCKIFHTHVKLNDSTIGLGIGRSKKESEQEAAKMALARSELKDEI